mmetsp:Transcript_22179/g.42308  ORF Transcript_22179/g.42308 Transcript_22179/m.42308 type:complete len:208 (+) Transcript_22179:90-713(+)
MSCLTSAARAPLAKKSSTLSLSTSLHSRAHRFLGGRQCASVLRATDDDQHSQAGIALQCAEAVVRNAATTQKVSYKDIVSALNLLRSENRSSISEHDVQGKWKFVFSTMSAINFPGLEYIPFKEVWDCNTYTQASTLQSNIPLGIVPKFTGSCSWQADQTVSIITNCACSFTPADESLSAACTRTLNAMILKVEIEPSLQPCVNLFQ